MCLIIKVEVLQKSSFEMFIVSVYHLTLYSYIIYGEHNLSFCKLVITKFLKALYLRIFKTESK